MFVVGIEDTDLAQGEFVVGTRIGPQSLASQHYSSDPRKEAPLEGSHDYFPPLWES